MHYRLETHAEHFPGGNAVKKPFVAPTLRSEGALAVLTLGTPCISNQCVD
jgi:hypothetical protein